MYKNNVNIRDINCERYVVCLTTRTRKFCIHYVESSHSDDAPSVVDRHLVYLPWVVSPLEYVLADRRKPIQRDDDTKYGRRTRQQNVRFVLVGRRVLSFLRAQPVACVVAANFSSRHPDGGVEIHDDVIYTRSPSQNTFAVCSPSLLPRF